MKLLLVGCMHGSVNKKIKLIAMKEKPDAVLCCGDLCDVDMLRSIEFGNINAHLMEFIFDKKRYESLIKKSVNSMDIPLKFFSSLDIPVFLVYGNNDYLDGKAGEFGLKGLESRLPKNVLLIRDSVVKFHGIYIAGFPGYKDVSKNRLDRLTRKIKYPSKTIFLTHVVPYKKFDLVTWKESPALGRHVGEKLFNERLRKSRLLAFICAHMHEHQGIDSLYGTPIINTGYGKAGKSAVLELEKEKIKKARFYR